MHPTSLLTAYQGGQALVSLGDHAERRFKRLKSHELATLRAFCDEMKAQGCGVAELDGFSSAMPLNASARNLICCVFQTPSSSTSSSKRRCDARAKKKRSVARYVPIITISAFSVARSASSPSSTRTDSTNICHSRTSSRVRMLQRSPISCARKRSIQRSTRTPSLSLPIISSPLFATVRDLSKGNIFSLPASNLSKKRSCANAKNILTPASPFLPPPAPAKLCCSMIWQKPSVRKAAAQRSFTAHL